MPRAYVKGSQICDQSITDADLADNAVITRTIKDLNVTRPKLALDVRERLLDSNAPITRVKLTSDFPAHTDFTLPGGKDYKDLATFTTRTKVWWNGQLLYMGASASDPGVDIYPGSETTKIKFMCELRRGAAITVEII